jgi:protein involved in polysaccharide export with SLBB domain
MSWMCGCPISSNRESTLFTVMKNGMLEYPLLNGPVSVVGLSTDEISRLLSSEIKVIKTPRVTVTVRDYASHAAGNRRTSR